MATYPPRRLLGARPLPSDLRRDPRRSGFPQGGGGRWERRLPTGQSLGPGNLRYWCTHFQGPAARQHHLLRIAFKIFLSSLFCSFTLCVQPFPLRIYKEEIVKEIKEEEKLSQITRIQEVEVLGIEPRTSCMLRRHSTTELYLSCQDPHLAGHIPGTLWRPGT
ncbi:uncharacterized protein LOC123615538 isoform X4 [Camelus bactrianus]|uniref:Uncharacterized protein LOC123615538 isoform X4 n=2 Tax=Camelus bactrianus TaxID=9837 RepID=A0AC58RAH4_CAMBA